MSFCQLHEFGDLQILQLAVLRDNYSYLLRDKGSGCTAALDPASDSAIMEALQRRHWRLHAIWNTHWHADHCGGNSALIEYARRQDGGLPADWQVAAFSKQKIAECTRELRTGDMIKLGNLQLQVFEVPGHTLDHLLYVYQSGASGCSEGPISCSIAFCGDALFSLGCGRLFEGNAAQLLQSLDCINRLPEQTLLFCAHEYTRANLRFALYLEPDNSALRQFGQKLSRLEGQRAVTIPSRLFFERQANPFLRIRCADFSMRLPDWFALSAVHRLARIRKMKDSFV